MEMPLVEGLSAYVRIGLLHERTLRGIEAVLKRKVLHLFEYGSKNEPEDA